MARVIVAPTARDDLDHLIKILKLPKSTRSRVRARLAQLADHPESGSELQDRWRGFRFILGPWTWMLIVYAFDEERSEEHTSELQSRGHLVCRLLLEKKKTHEQTRDCKLTTLRKQI